MALKRSFAAALFGAALSIGILTGFALAQESNPAVTTASTLSMSKPQFTSLFEQQMLIDGTWINANSASPDSLAQAPEQWVRGTLIGKVSTPECPRHWSMVDAAGDEYYDAAFGTIGSPYGSTSKLLGLIDGNVEVHLVKDMHCMNTSELTWRLASVEPLGTTQVTWKAWFPIALRSYSIISIDTYSGWIEWNGELSTWVVRNACRQVAYTIDNPAESWIGHWVRFNAARTDLTGYDKLHWDGSTFTISANGEQCWWTPTPTFTPTPGYHNDIWGWLERADPRECAHAYIRTCNGMARIPVRHRNGPAYFEPFIGKEVQTAGLNSTVCNGAQEIDGLGLVPGFCGRIVSPTPTFTPTVVPTTDPNMAEGYVIIDTGSCGNARLLTHCRRTYGWITNADPSWNGRWVRFRINDFGVCSDPSLVKVTWDNNTSTVSFPLAPTCATPTPTYTPTWPVPSPTDTPTFTPSPVVPTAVPTTPVPPTQIPPTAVPGGFTAYLLTVRPDDNLGECGLVYGILCGGEIVKIANPPVFTEGTSYSFNANWLNKCRHDDHGHRVLEITSALVPVTCPSGSVDIPAWKPCEGPLCWAYKITEMSHLPPLVLLLPYPRLTRSHAYPE